MAWLRHRSHRDRHRHRDRQCRADRFRQRDDRQPGGRRPHHAQDPGARSVGDDDPARRAAALASSARRSRRAAWSTGSTWRQVRHRLGSAGHPPRRSQVRRADRLLRQRRVERLCRRRPLSALRRPARGLFPRRHDHDPLPAIVTTNGPGWTARRYRRIGLRRHRRLQGRQAERQASRLARRASAVRLRAQGQASATIPRLDSTVSGGSGTHRWDDPSTWEWSENPAVCRYNWVRGIYANDQVSDPALLGRPRAECHRSAAREHLRRRQPVRRDVVGSGVRYRVAGPVYANQEFIDVEEMFALATAGSTVTRQGSVELEPGQAKSDRRQLHRR
jgi:hypothetical protein